MSTKMRQVTREDFEVLTKYHPGEIRYYVDVDKALPSRRKPTRVTVKRRPVATKKKVVKRTARTYPLNGTGRGYNRPIIFVGGESLFTEKSVKCKRVEEVVKGLFAADPTRIIGRVDLVNKVVAATTLSKGTVTPVISNLLKGGVIKYKEAATS